MILMLTHKILKAIPLTVILCVITFAPTFASITHSQSFEFRMEDIPDEKAQYSIVDVPNLPFSLTGNHMANYGLKSHPVWVKISLNALTIENLDRLFLSINFPPLDNIQVFMPRTWIAPHSYTRWQSSDAPDYVMKQMGDHLPFNSRDILSQNFEVDFLPAKPPYPPIYIRISTSTNLQAPIKIYSPNQKTQAQITDSLMYGAYFGLMLVMILYNGFIYITTRMRAYLYYVLFNSALFLVQISNRGFAYQYLWPESVWWNQNSIFIGSGFVFAFSALFIRSFMDTKSHSPIFDKLLIAGAFLGIIQTLLTLTGFFTLSVKLSVFAGLFIPLTALTLGLTRLYIGDRRALLFVTAWTVLLVSAIAWHLTLSGILTITKATTYYLIIGSSIEVVLLSLALGDEINHQRRSVLLHEKNEERFLLEKQAAEHSNHAKSVFLANISHELRTPLNSIIGFTQRVLSTTQNSLSPRHQDALRIVVTNAEHLSQLVDNLIDVSQIESGSLSLKLGSVSLNKICNDVGEQLSSLAEEKNLYIKMDLDPKLGSITGDSLRLRQVIINLVSNAIKFTDQGSITVKTGNDIINGTSVAFINVIDTGPGISDEFQDTIFNRFQRDIKNVGIETIDGYGIGLSLCKEIMVGHGGTVSVESQLGQGSTFIVRFPN